jgi:hypothetical protein
MPLIEVNDGDYVIRKLPDGRWHAEIINWKYEYTGPGPVIDVIRGLNVTAFHKNNEMKANVARQFDRLQDEWRKKAGLPSWTYRLPGWALFGYKKKERQAGHSRMIEIMDNVREEHKDLPLAQQVDLMIWKFNQEAA